jgi:hypothetical protein
MHDLLTPEEDVAASAAGWGVYDVYDMKAGKWRVMVLGEPHAEAASRRVVEQARHGSKLAQKALALVMHGPPKRKGRR